MDRSVLRTHVLNRSGGHCEWTSCDQRAKRLISLGDHIWIGLCEVHGSRLQSSDGWLPVMRELLVLRHPEGIIFDSTGHPI